MLFKQAVDLVMFSSSSLQVLIILIAGVVGFCRISGQNKEIIVSVISFLSIMDATVVSTVHIETLRSRMTEYAQSLTGGYRGSRIEKARYMYENTVHANFIELSADHRLEPEEFRVLLENVQGVREVTLHGKSKAEQGNLGAQDPTRRTPRRGHYQAHNFMVFSTLFPNDCRGMEFELTESLHMRNPRFPLTISACYKIQ